MKSREVVTKDNYKQIVLKRMIILCWILLAVCFVVKIFGGNFFNIVCQNERFIKVCEYVDENVWLQYVIGCISTLFLQTLYLLAISKHLWFTRKREFIIVILSTLLGVWLRMYLGVFPYLFDIYQYAIMPFIIKDKFKFVVKTRRIILSFILNLVFQIISMLVKNLALVYLTSYGMLITLIYCIDVNIMVILYYLYVNLQKENNMGLFMNWMWGKSTKQLEKMKATRLEKRAKLDQEIAEINSELDRQKNENK